MEANLSSLHTELGARPDEEVIAEAKKSIDAHFAQLRFKEIAKRWHEEESDGQVDVDSRSIFAAPGMLDHLLDYPSPFEISAAPDQLRCMLSFINSTCVKTNCNHDRSSTSTRFEPSSRKGCTTITGDGLCLYSY